MSTSPGQSLPPAIALVRAGSFSRVNEHLMAELQRVFQEYPLEALDAGSLLLRPASLPRLFLSLAIRQGATAFRNRRNLRRAVYRSPVAFRLLKRQLANRIGPESHLFSIQTQSLWDASVPDLPHFVYTDHTALAHARYATTSEVFDQEWLRLEPRIYDNAARVFTTSNFARDSLIEQYGCEPEKVQCVYSGINVPFPESLPKFEQRNPEILFVGLEWERKGGPELVEAFRHVRRSNARAQLTIVGCSPTLDLEGCEVLGRVESPAVVEAYRRASVFCLPSRQDPSAVALSEAAAHGLPVVSTRVGGTADRVLDGETGYLVEAGDPLALADRLLRLLENPEEAQAFGAAGRQLAFERFRWPVVVDRMASQIRSHLSSEVRGSAGKRSEPVLEPAAE